MIGVDVGCNFEDETGEFLLLGLYCTLFGCRGTWIGRNFYKAVQQFLDTEIIERRTEENRCYTGGQVILVPECGIDALNEFQVLAQLLGVLLWMSTVTFSVTFCLSGVNRLSCCS